MREIVKKYEPTIFCLTTQLLKILPAKGWDEAEDIIRAELSEAFYDYKHPQHGIAIKARKEAKQAETAVKIALDSYFRE